MQEVMGTRPRAVASRVAAVYPPEHGRAPTEAAPEAAEGAPRDARQPEPTAPAEATSWRVLVVDDDPDIVASVALTLGMAGHRVRGAHDGPAALALAAVFQPEVVVLNLGLPGMSGYEVARR